MSSSIWWWLISGVRGDEQQAGVTGIFHLSIPLSPLRYLFPCSLLQSICFQLCLYLGGAFLNCYFYLSLIQHCRLRRVTVVTWAEDGHKVDDLSNSEKLFCNHQTNCPHGELPPDCSNLVWVGASSCWFSRWFYNPDGKGWWPYYDFFHNPSVFNLWPLS